jgi:DNA primase
MKESVNNKLYFFERLTNRYQLSKDGLNISIWCPFCKHDNINKLKLVVHLEKNFWHCWLCDKKGSDVSYIVSRYDKSKVLESKKIFKKKNINSDFQINLFGEADLNDFEEEQRVELPKDFRLLSSNFDSNHPDIRDVFKYTVKRGINKHKLLLLRLGVSLDNDFVRRLIIPSFNDNGDINFYTARRIDVDSSSPIKYKNASVSKKDIIFNELFIDWSIPLTLVEGPLDLLKTNDNATCLLGSSLTYDMKLFRKIVENKTEINLALDKDVYFKTLKIAKLLSEYDVKVNILDTRIANDVGDMSHTQFEECLNNAKEYKQDDFLLTKISMI